MVHSLIVLKLKLVLPGIYRQGNKSQISAAAREDPEYANKVETIKLEHYNMRTKALKYLYSIDSAVADERRPSRYHLKWPICLEYCKSSFELSDWGHSFWKLWLRGYIEMKIQNSLVYDMVCPMSECKKKIATNLIMQVSTDEMMK